MPRKPKQQRSKATVEAIIEAAFICVADKGLHNTTTRHIAEVAGISVGSLYEYFANKEMIFEAMQQHMVAEVVAMIQPLIPEIVRMSVPDAIRVILRNFEAFLLKNDERYLKCARYAVQTEIGDYLQPVAKILSELAMQHILHNPENVRLRHIPAMTYIFINGGIYSVLRHLSDPHPPVSFEELTEGLATMVGHYVSQEMWLTGGGAPA